MNVILTVHFCIRDATGTHPIPTFTTIREESKNKICPIAFLRSYKNILVVFSIREMQMSYF